MQFWIENSLGPYLESRNLVSSPTADNGRGLSLLLMDNFSAHQISNVRKAVMQKGCSISFLPPNTTSKTQILDVGINKPFKDRMRSRYCEFLIDFEEQNAENQENEGPNEAREKEERKPRVDRRTMSTWVADTWDEITAEMIKNTSIKIGFTDPVRIY